MKITINAQSGGRLDVILAAQTEYTRSRIATLVDGGNVTVNGATAVKSGQKLCKGDVIEVDVPEVVTKIEGKDIPVEILYQDDDIAVINKPQGLTVHPASGNYDNTLVNALMFSLDKLSGINGEVRPGIVHRLDKDTSGVMVIAKNDTAHLSLSRQIADRTVKKEYIALVEGKVKNPSGKIVTKIGRNPKNRKLMAVTSDGREAITEYTVVEQLENHALVLFHIITGRTHQIRVHSKYMGNPVVGDASYGYKKQKFNLSGQLLHAYRLTLTHPTSGERMTFIAPVPEIMRKVYDGLALKEKKRTLDSIQI